MTKESDTPESEMVWQLVEKMPGEGAENSEWQEFIRSALAGIRTRNFADRTFVLGKGHVLVGILPFVRPDANEDDPNHERLYGVTLTPADNQREIGNVDSGGEFADVHYDRQIYMVVPSLEWACRIANSLFENNDQERMTPERWRQQEAEILAKAARPPEDEPGDLGPPDDQQ